MKLTDREHVQGTQKPSIYIGRRLNRNGTASRNWSAIYYDGSRQVVKSLRTRYKNDAIKSAHDLHRALIRGEPTAPPEAITVAQLVREYLDMLIARGRSHKTITKYTRMLEDFTGVCEKGLQWKREKSPKNSSGGTGNGPSKKS